MSKQPTRNSISNTNKRNREINETAPVQSFGFVSVGLHHDRYGKFVGIRREIQIKIELERKSRNAPVTEMRFDRAALCILSTSTMLCGVGNYSTANRMRHPLKWNIPTFSSALVTFLCRLALTNLSWKQQPQQFSRKREQECGDTPTSIPTSKNIIQSDEESSGNAKMIRIWTIWPDSTSHWSE